MTLIEAGQIFRQNVLLFLFLVNPHLILLSFLTAAAAWQPNIPSDVQLAMLASAFAISVSCAWALAHARQELVRGWFFLAFLVNICMAVWAVSTKEKGSIPVGILYSAYSIWQFHVFREPFPKFKPRVKV